MKKRLIINAFFVLAAISTLKSQDTTDQYPTPNVQEDLIESKKFFPEIYYEVCIPGFTGIGVNSTYLLNKNVQISSRLGWGFGFNVWDYDTDFFTRYGMFDIDLRAGYVLFSDKQIKENSWTVSRASDGFYITSVMST